MSEESHKQIGDYQILNEIGSGGMGRVYRVRNVISDRIEAMKVLLPDLAGRQELAARFLREIKVLASLNHPNIGALRTALTVDNQLVMIMEYVEGVTLAERLKQGPIPVADTLNYLDQVLNALSYAHQQNVIHRDIKPANIIVTPQGVVKLMDFGIARSGVDRSLTMTGTTLGSLSYMSPEQVKGEATDARSDLYSVGITLYELVTGQQPFRAHSDYSIMAAHVKETPKPPIELAHELPPALNEIILMAIAKDPAQRFQTADALRNALSSVHPAAVASQAAQSVAAVTSDAAVTATLQAVPAMTSPNQAAAPVRTPTAQVAPASTPPSVPAPPPPQISGHRGLYMTLGALIVLAVLLAAGIYVPRKSKTRAAASPSRTPPASALNMATGSQDEPQLAPPATPTTSSASSTAMPPQGVPTKTQPQEVEGLSTTPPSPMASQPPSSHLRRGNAKTHGSGPVVNATLQESDTGAQLGGAASTTATKAVDDGADLDELEHRLDQLSGRAAGVNASLDRMQQEQNNSGYGLRADIRADIVTKHASMKANLSKAEDAVQKGDVVRAKKYLDLAQGDVEALEHFLGH